MTLEEIRVRSVYLFLACSQGVEQVVGTLVGTFPSPPLSAKLLIERSLKRELGLLFRYWTTRHIWELLESNEADAKALNLALLRLFTEAFHLPRDGSGLRYAELSTVDEEIREIGQRITSVVGLEHAPLLAALRDAVAPWRDAVSKYTRDALFSPLEQLTPAVRAWMERAPDPTRENGQTGHG